MLMEMSLCFFHLLLKQVNTLVVINYPYAKTCVPGVLKNVNVNVFNIMSENNEARHIKWHEAYKCECKFGVNVCNNKQRWNKAKDKGICNKRFIWNPST